LLGIYNIQFKHGVAGEGGSGSEPDPEFYNPFGIPNWDDYRDDEPYNLDEIIESADDGRHGL
jgi:hypothetical protein